jgi:protein-S-isoprenylcysteine O-methyltransferase Ste14
MSYCSHYRLATPEGAMSNRLAVPLVSLAFFALAVVLPSVRLRRCTGVNAITFRRSKDRSQRIMGALFALGMLALAAWVLAVAALGPRLPGSWLAPGWMLGCGWCGVAGGFALVLVAQREMGASWRIGIDGQPTALVTRGVFRWIRNPIFTGMLLSLGGAVAIAPSLPAIALWVCFALAIAFQVRLEEDHLRHLHAESYLQYARHTSRFVPGLGRLRPGR